MASNTPDGEMVSSTPPSLPPKVKRLSVKEREDYFAGNQVMDNVSPKPVPKPRSKPSFKQSPNLSPTKPRPTPRSRTSVNSVTSAGSANSSTTDLSFPDSNSDFSSDVLSASAEFVSSVYDNPKSENVKEAIYANEGDQNSPLETDIGGGSAVYENTPSTTSQNSECAKVSSTEPSEAIYANEPTDIPKTEKLQMRSDMFSLPMYLNESSSTSGSTSRSSEAISLRSSISRTSGVYNVEAEEHIYWNETTEFFSSTDAPNEKRDSRSDPTYFFDDLAAPKPCSNSESNVDRSKQPFPEIFPFSPPVTYANESPDVSSVKFDKNFDQKPEKLSDFLLSVKEEHDNETKSNNSDEIQALTRKTEKNDNDKPAASLDLNENKQSVSRPDQSLSLYINSLGSSFPEADDFEQMIDKNLEKKKEDRLKDSEGDKQSQSVSVRKEKHPFQRSDAISDSSQDAISPPVVRDPIKTADSSSRFSVQSEEAIYEAIWVSKKKEKEMHDRRESSTDDFNDDSLMSFSPNRDSPLTLNFVPNKTTESDNDVPKVPEKPKVTPEIWGEYACLDPNAVYVTPPPHFPPPPLPNRSTMPTADPPPLPNIQAPLTSSQAISNAPPVPPRSLHEINQGMKSSSPVPSVKSSSPVPKLIPSRPAPVKSRSPIPEPVNIPDSINAKYKPTPPDSSVKPTPTDSNKDRTSYMGHDPVERQDSDVFKGFQTPKMELFQDDPFKYSDFATVCENFNTTGSTTEQKTTNEFASWDPFGTNSTSVSSATSSTPSATNSTPSEDRSKFDPFGLDGDNVSDQSASSDWYNRISLRNVPPPPISKRVSPKNLGSEFAEASRVMGSCSTGDSDCSDTDSEEPYNTGLPRVPLITRNPTSPKNEKCGYLYKQGGVNANKGWRKRWVVFNGTDLRYYVNNKSQVSKRIIPLTCISDVVNDVKTDDTSRFKFKLITSIKDRVFHFAADKLEECLQWSQTIMAAIYQRNGSTPDNSCLEGKKSDKEGFIKFENGGGKKYFVAISESRLCYYHNKDDYMLNSPIHEIMMKLASVKDSSSGKNRLQLSTHYGHFMLGFENSTDCQQWKMAMEDAIAEGLADDSVLEKVYENESNKICADCEATDPHWASINLGIVVCKKCAGIHRMFEYTISKIRSLRMDTRVWTPSLIELMKAIGNANANNFWEHELVPEHKIEPDSTSEERKEFIQNKYKYKRYSRLHPAYADKNILNQELLKCAVTDDVLETMAIVFSGADVLYHAYGQDETAYQLAKRIGERLQVEFLYQNCGDESTLASEYNDDGRLREDVRHQGFLLKTGPNFKGFDKRWCILEHGTLTYYDSERSTTAKDSIERKYMLMITTTTIEKQAAAFEISTNRNNQRVYLFSAENETERRLWLQALSRLICPITVMDHVGMMDFSLAGNFYMKDSIAEDWSRTWIMVNWRILYYLNKETNKLETVDLRKASSIKHQGSETGCNKCLETGYHFVVNSPGRALYIQADLSRDTERLRIELEKSIKGSGTALDDQQLTSDNVPVIVDRCLNYVTNNGIKTRGIYRESATHSRVNLLLTELRHDPRSVRLEDYSDHEVANAVKRFLRGLTSSVFTQDYIQWMQTAAITEIKNKLAWYSYLLDRMPEIHFSTLKKIVMHLHKVNQYTSENQMTLENLATCFAPSLLIPDASEVTSSYQTNLPLQLCVISDIINYYDSLFRLDQEKSIEDKMDEAERKIKDIESSPRMSMPSDSLLIPITKYELNGDCEMMTITARNTAMEVVDYFYNKRIVKERNFNLHEILFDGKLERPLHWSNQVFLDVCRWSDWTEDIRKGFCLCLKRNELMGRINDSYDPSKYLLSELKYSEKKSFKKMTFDFKQSRFSCYKDSKANNCLWSINAEDMIIYIGVDPRRSSIPSKFGFTFLSKHEKPSKNGYFGKSVCFTSQEDLYKWVSAILMAQYPEGLLY